MKSAILRILAAAAEYFAARAANYRLENLEKLRHERNRIASEIVRRESDNSRDADGATLELLAERLEQIDSALAVFRAAALRGSGGDDGAK